jgi:hypothetical protein
MKLELKITVDIDDSATVVQAHDLRDLISEALDGVDGAGTVDCNFNITLAPEFVVKVP